MKKFFVFTLCALLFFTNISFANTISLTDSIKDIEMVNDRMYINDDSKANHFIEACSSYQQANVTLNTLKLKNKEPKKRQEQSKKENSVCN